jgi:hypothetical protein
MIMPGVPQTCPDYDNDEAMAALGRVCVDIFLNVQWNGDQGRHQERIAGSLYQNVSGVCEDAEEDEDEDEAANPVEEE